MTSTDNRAGAHPDVTTSFSFNTVNDPTYGERPVAPFKTVRLSLPAGLVGDAADVPQCPAATFGAGLIGGGDVPRRHAGGRGRRSTPTSIGGTATAR